MVKTLKIVDKKIFKKLNNVPFKNVIWLTNIELIQIQWRKILILSEKILLQK
jgi:hypothetical protein